MQATKITSSNVEVYSSRKQKKEMVLAPLIYKSKSKESLTAGSNFKNKFKGKIVQTDKLGHFGVVASTDRPIFKNKK